VTWLAVLLALGCAATFAISSSVQHQAATGAPESAQGILGLLGYLVQRPAWLLGQLLATSAFALHAAALHSGPIAVVQPIVVSGIVWAVPARAAVSRVMPSVTELRAVLITATGLAVFLVASNPTAGETASLGHGTVMFALVGVTVALAAEITAQRIRGDGRRKAFFLGAVGGVLFGMVAGFLKITLQTVNAEGLAGLLTAWTTYALLLAGAGGVLTNQRAYRAAGLSASLPVLNIVNGLTALAFGFTVFGEVPRHSPLFLLIEAGALACMATGLWMLVGFEEAHQEDAASVEPAATPRR